MLATQRPLGCKVRETQAMSYCDKAVQLDKVSFYSSGWQPELAVVAGSSAAGAEEQEQEEE